MDKWIKGMYVYIRSRDNSINTETKYRIRSIGKKQVILDKLEYFNRGYTKAGFTLYKYSPEELVERLSRDPSFDPYWMPTDWSQVMQPCGDENWNAEENFYS